MEEHPLFEQGDACPACKARDGRRAAGLQNHPDYSDLSMGRILRACALCDAHGFLVTAKHGDEENGQEARQRLHKETLIDFSYALALPNRYRETTQLHTRSGASKEEGQMLMKLPARSGDYALLVRYFSVGVGADTERWDLHVQDEQERTKRHQAILRALRDTLVSPDGALTATMLPHLTGLVGVIVVTSAAGRAPVYSALQQDFMERLQGMASDTLQIYPFETVDGFYTLMNRLIATSTPALARAWLAQGGEEHRKEERL